MNTTHCPECLSTDVGAIDPADKTIDCLACGVWWDATSPDCQPDHPLFGKPLLDGPPALLYRDPWLDTLFAAHLLCQICEERPWTQLAARHVALLCAVCAEGEPQPDERTTDAPRD